MMNPSEETNPSMMTNATQLSYETSDLSVGTRCSSTERSSLGTSDQLYSSPRDKSTAAGDTLRGDTPLHSTNAQATPFPGASPGRGHQPTRMQPPAPPPAGAAPNPELQIYLEPLNPYAALSLRDRIQLIAESCRPWSEFFDWRAIMLPRLENIKPQVLVNIESFFYNYVVMSGVCLVVSGLLNIGSFILLIICLATGYFFFVAHPEPIQIGDSFVLGKQYKTLILAVASLLALTAGHVLHLVMQGAILAGCASAVHAVLRDFSQTDVV